VDELHFKVFGAEFPPPPGATLNFTLEMLEGELGYFGWGGTVTERINRVVERINMVKLRVGF
jgi:hypothetical protein